MSNLYKDSWKLYKINSESHPDAWYVQNGIIEKFEFNNGTATHITRNDLSKRNENKGLWIDKYIYESEREIYSYPTKIYESIESLIPYLIGTSSNQKDIV